MRAEKAGFNMCGLAFGEHQAEFLSVRFQVIFYSFGCFTGFRTRRSIAGRGSPGVIVVLVSLHCINRVSHRGILLRC